MKRLTIFFVIFCFAVGSALIHPQQDERKIAEALSDRLGDKLDFKEGAFSEKYRVIDPKAIWFDVDEKNRDAVLYFRSHPVFRFSIRIVDYESEKISIGGKEYVLTGNTDNRIILDRAARNIFVKKKENSGRVRKVMFSAVTVQATPNGKIRFLVRGGVDISLDLNNTRNKKSSGDFYLKDIFVFSLDADYLKVRGSVQGIWTLKGNTRDELALNRSRKILYFRTGHPLGTWARLEEVR